MYTPFELYGPKGFVVSDQTHSESYVYLKVPHPSVHFKGFLDKSQESISVRF